MTLVLGRPVTPYEREILEIIQEEAAEVIQAASKMLRFGVDTRNPKTGDTNEVELGREVGDLRCIERLAVEAHLIDMRDVFDGVERKAANLKIYMQHGSGAQHD